MMSRDSSPYEVLLKSFIAKKTVDRIAQKQTRHTSIAWEDAVNAAYEKLWQVASTGKFCGSEEEFPRWAATVSYNAILDYCRQQRQWQCESLDQCIPGTDIPLLETLVDEFDALDAIDRADRMCQVTRMIAELDRKQPQHNYLKIWQGLVLDKTQQQIAQELDVEFYSVSKRWKTLRQQIAACFITMELVQQQIRPPDRRRSQQYW